MNDFILNSDYEMIIENGDFKVGDATAQNQKLIMLAQKGEVKQTPLTGVGIADWLKGEKQSGLKSEIRQQLKADGMNVKKIDINNNTINIDAAY